ncbi:MAG: RNA polymerase sigma factor [Actinomycetota bacterium]
MAAERPLDRLDSELVERATSGEAAAVEAIVTTLTTPVYNLALRMLHAHHDAEEATQEALIRVVTNLSSFQGRSRFSTWAWTIATRAILDYGDGRARRPMLSAAEFSEDLADGLGSPNSASLNSASSNIGDPETTAILGQVKLGCGRAMLQTLSGDLRVAYTLGEILDLDQTEAAAALGLSPAAYRKRLSRARSQLRAVLDANCGIVDRGNNCRCALRRDRAIQLRRLEPADAVDLDVDALSRTVRQLDGLGRVAAYFRADPEANASERLLPYVRAVLGVS